MANIHKLSPGDANGTFAVGSINATYDQLVEVFGLPSYGPDEDPDDKVTCDWTLDIDGTVCTIYDWKEYTSTPRGYYDWHIGGFNRSAEDKVFNAIQEYYKEIKNANS